MADHFSSYLHGNMPYLCLLGFKGIINRQSIVTRCLGVYGIRVAVYLSCTLINICFFLFLQLCGILILALAIWLRVSKFEQEVNK